MECHVNWCPVNQFLHLIVDWLTYWNVKWLSFLRRANMGTSSSAGGEGRMAHPAPLECAGIFSPPSSAAFSFSSFLSVFFLIRWANLTCISLLCKGYQLWRWPAEARLSAASLIDRVYAYGCQTQWHCDGNWQGLERCLSLPPPCLWL